MAAVYSPYRADRFYSSSLNIGDDGERQSAKRRRQNALRSDLELQMAERHAARQRERLQDMSVDASGYLDPEKGPERLKPLGGVDWTQYRSKGDSRVRPYHTLFLYEEQNRPQVAAAAPINTYRAPSYDDAYSVMAARDITLAPQVPLVQPLQPMHYPDTRPIVIQQPAPSYEWHGPKYNPFTYEVPNRASNLLLNRSKTLADIDKPLDDLSDQLEQARLKIKMERDNEEHKRRLQRELDENQRRMRDQEQDAKRRLEQLRLESEERRREEERRRREWERLLRLRELERPRSIPCRPLSKRHGLLDDMDIYRNRLREERRTIEQLLMNRKPVEPAKLDIKVVRKKRETTQEVCPPTPPTPDNANPENVHTFIGHKHRDFKSRNLFRATFPEVPYTNKKLEWQQGALLTQQEEGLRLLREAKTDNEKQVIMKKYFFTRPVWMDREITPFGRMRGRHRSLSALDAELDCLAQTDRGLAKIDERDPLVLRSYRPCSTDTLNDDTWIRPSSADV